MDYFDMLTEQRIDSETADLVDALLEQALPSLQPCDCPLETVLRQLADKYPLTVLPRESTHYAQTALAVIESDFPEDADYLPHDWEDRLEQALGLTGTLHMQLFCAEIRDELYMSSSASSTNSALPVPDKFGAACRCVSARKPIPATAS